MWRLALWSLIKALVAPMVLSVSVVIEASKDKMVLASGYLPLEMN